MSDGGEKDVHALEVSEAFERVDSSAEGLTGAEVARRLEIYGTNTLPEAPSEPLWKRFLSQFQDFTIYLLIGAAIFSAFLAVALNEPRHFGEAGVIAVVITLNAVLGTFQEGKAESAMQALKELTQDVCKVIRDGEEQLIEAAQVVPGDIVVLEQGMRVPADARIFETLRLEVDESSFTGESVPVSKGIEPVPENTNLAERTSMVFTSTIVTQGRGRAVVLTTGQKTELGHIGQLVAEDEDTETPLAEKLDRLGRQIGKIALWLIVVIAGISLIKYFIFTEEINRDNLVTEIFEIILVGISLAVAVIPEGLPIILVITLGLGMKRMADSRAIVRKLKAVETLGCTTYICSDKTGTLTRNQMTVKEIYCLRSSSMLAHYRISGDGFRPTGAATLDTEPVADPSEDKLLVQVARAAHLCNNSILHEESGRWGVVGNPTEGALRVVAKKLGFDQLEMEELYPKQDELFFSSTRKRMTTIHQNNGKRIAFSKGAPGIFTELCTRVLRDDAAITPLTEEDVEAIEDANYRMASNGLRVLCLAYRELDEDVPMDEDEIEKELIFIGLVGIMDPPREEAKEAIKLAQQAGIKVVMITGDQQLTAVAVGVELGIIDEQSQFLLGHELDEMGDEELSDIIEDVSVYSRVSPEHKMRIVRLLQNRGHTVAMTGDGVNDAPALSRADIGVAMGITGTDVAKDAADMVLQDDNFTNIVDAVEEGRKIYNNIRSFVRYQISTNVGAVLLLVIAVLLSDKATGGSLPLTPAHILWINIIIDGPPAMALSWEKIGSHVMLRKPYARDERILSKEMLFSISLLGTVMALGSLFLYLWFIAAGFTVEVAQTVAFTSFILFQFVNVMNCRSARESIFSIGIFANRVLTVILAAMLLIQFVFIYTPVAAFLFTTTPIALWVWGVMVLVSFSVLVVEEARKWIFRHFHVFEEYLEPGAEVSDGTL